MDTVNPDSLSRESIQIEVVAILEQMTSDWDMDFAGGITNDTRLIGDLEFESIDVVQFIVAIEERYERRDFPFEKLLMTEGRYVDEIRVQDAIDFIHKHLTTTT